METAQETRIDLDAYMARIGYEGDLQPTVATLKAIHSAHATRIPFENVDVLLGLPIRLDLPSLEAKLVRGRRGGYCFEQNMLLSAVLEQLGFTVNRLQARVRLGSQQILPRTHMALEVIVDGGSWLADVGFGAWGLIEPLPLSEGESRQFAWTYRLKRDGDQWVLQAPRANNWLDLYAFTREPHLPVDYEPGNFYVSKHPDSIFVRTLTAQLPTQENRYVLRNREFTVVSAAGESTETLGSECDLLRVLVEHFKLELPPGTRLPAAALEPFVGR